MVCVRSVVAVIDGFGFSNLDPRADSRLLDCALVARSETNDGIIKEASYILHLIKE